MLLVQAHSLHLILHQLVCRREKALPRALATARGCFIDVVRRIGAC